MEGTFDWGTGAEVLECHSIHFVDLWNFSKFSGRFWPIFFSAEFDFGAGN